MPVRQDRLTLGDVHHYIASSRVSAGSQPPVVSPLLRTAAITSPGSTPDLVSSTDGMPERLLLSRTESLGESAGPASVNQHPSHNANHFRRLTSLLNSRPFQSSHGIQPDSPHDSVRNSIGNVGLAQGSRRVVPSLSIGSSTLRPEHSSSIEPLGFASQEEPLFPRTERLRQIRSELERLRVAVHITRIQLRSTEASLHATQAELRELQATLLGQETDTQAIFHEMRVTLHATEASLQEMQTALRETQARLRETHVRLREQQTHTRRQYNHLRRPDEALGFDLRYPTADSSAGSETEED